LKKNNSESIFKNNKSELVKLPKNINEVKSEINFLTKSDKKKDNELK
jgi:virulence-associated protein VagC